MPPKVYPKLRLEDGSEKGRIRRGYVPIEALRKAISSTNSLEERLIIKLLYYCGLRASEVGLQPASHFDARHNTLEVLRLKGSFGRTYKLEPWLLEDMKAWMAKRPKSKFLFCHHDFRTDTYNPDYPMDRFCVFQIWKRAAQRAGLPKALQHPHVLKHSVATHMLERGDDLTFVQNWLGHRSMESTQVYAEVVGKRLQEGQEVMRGLVEELE